MPVTADIDTVSSNDLRVDPEQLDGSGVVAYLDSRIADVLTEIESSEFWQTALDPNTDPQLVMAVMREVYLEIVMYQPDVIEATIATIAQFPRTMDVGLINEMLHHQVEEFDHGEMALRDYIAAGGDAKSARNRRMSPTAFSVAAMWRMLCHKREPFAYLGALYPFEGLTPIVTGKIKSHLARHGMKADSLEFVEYHSTADLEHTETVRKLITEIVNTYPESRTSICYGIEYFLAVYPMPGWTAAFARAKRNMNLL